MKHAREMVAVLVNIRSLHNVGSMFRTADAAGIKKLYCAGITPEPLDRLGKYRSQISKVALGAEHTVPWDGSARSPRATLVLLEKLKKDGYKIFAVEQHRRATPYYKAALSKHKKIALIMGNEVQGLTPSVLRKADTILEIPMRGAMVRHAHHPRRIRRGKESLNVSVAFGVIAYFLAFGYNRNQ